MAGKRRALTTIRDRTTGPERFLSLAALEADAPPRRMTTYMGEAGSECIEIPAHRGGQPLLRDRRNELTRKNRDRVAQDAQRLLDELNGVVRNKAIEDRLRSLAAEEKQPEPEPAAEEKIEDPPEPAPQVEEEKQEEEPAPAPVEEPPAQEKEPTPKAAEPEPEPTPEPVVETVKPRAGPEAKNGFMEKFAVGKSAMGSKNWKRRYFSISASFDAALTYAESETSKVLGTVPVNDPATRLVTEPSLATHAEAKPDTHTDIVIIFFEDKAERRLLLRCDDPTSRASWIDELCKRVATVDAAGDF